MAKALRAERMEAISCVAQSVVTLAHTSRHLFVRICLNTRRLLERFDVFLFDSFNKICEVRKMPPFFCRFIRSGLQEELEGPQQSRRGTKNWASQKATPSSKEGKRFSTKKVDKF